MKKLFAVSLLTFGFATYADEAVNLNAQEANTITITMKVTCNDTTSPEWAGIKAATKSMVDTMQSNPDSLFSEACHADLMTIETLAKSSDDFDGEIHISTSAE